MNILFVVPYVPSLVRVRSFNFIRTLSERGHRVSVMTLFTNDAEREDASRLADLCHAVYALPLPRWRSMMNSLMALPTAKPLQVDYCWQPSLAREIESVISNGQDDWESFDVIHVEHLRGVRYALLARQLASGSGHALPPVIWDSVDCISLLFREAAEKSRNLMGRAMTRFELKRTEQYEGWVTGQLSHILLSSQRDRECLLSLQEDRDVNGDGSSISVVLNGVDLEYFRPDAEKKREPASVVVTGKMSYHANIAMVLYLAREIMPLVWQRRPETKLTVVGKDPGKEIRNLALNPQIEVTGYVDDMRPYLQRATAAVAPLMYGAGIQNKVLEAMACATPVVTSPSALLPLSAVAGRDLLVANSPEEYAEKILFLFDNPSRSKEIGWNGRRFVEVNHDWDRIAVSLERVYQRAIEQEPSSRVPA